MLRIACEDSNKGAEVIVDGKVKGKCPLDLQVSEGMVKLRVRQVVDDLEEHVYEEEMQIGDGVRKTIDVELGPSQISAKGEQYLDRYWAAKLHEDEQRASSGDPKAMMEMANNFDYGYQNILKRSTEKNVLWIRKAADAGHPGAMQKLSMYYAKGEAGFQKSDEQSQVWRLRAAEAGNTFAISELTEGYSLGEYGIKKDEVQHEIWVRKGFDARLKKAKAGDPGSMADVGESYRDGYGVEKNRDEGLKWFKGSAATYRTLADAGDWRAMSRLSESYYDEKGEKMSPERKQYWSKLAKARSAWFFEFKELRAFVQRTEGAAR
jgi:TPR repeat protein